MISIKVFKIVAKDGNLSLFSGASAVQSRPKSHTFTVNLAVFAPQARWRSKTVEGSILVKDAIKIDMWKMNFEKF